MISMYPEKYNGSDTSSVDDTKTKKTPREMRGLKWIEGVNESEAVLDL